MIDLTPLDVRKKRGDFRKVLRGYDADEVDGFIEMVAERLEELVKENLTLRERVERLQDQVSQQEDREEAVREALVTAQELRRDMRQQARKEAELLRREAEGEIDRIVSEAERRLSERREALEEVERMRLRFLKSFRALLEREMDAVEVEEGRKPLEDIPLEIDFTVQDLEARVETTDPSATGGADPDDSGRGSSGSAGSGGPESSFSRGESSGDSSDDRTGSADAVDADPSGGDDGSSPHASAEETGTEAGETIQKEGEEGPLLLTTFLDEDEEPRGPGDSAP